MDGNIDSSSYGENIITKLNDLRKIICLRKSKVSVERISVCNVIEKYCGSRQTPSVVLLYQ